MDKISVTILTKNSQQYLKEVLKALAAFDELVIYDTGSTDETLNIASEFPNVKILHGTLVGFGPTHNIASAAAKNDWILSIDSDEIVSEPMASVLASLDLNPRAVYSFPRHNYFNGKFIKYCGWYPDRQFRLYNRTKTHFSDAQVHEAILTEGLQKIDLKAPLLHYSYASIADFLSKMQSYSTLFAKQYAGHRQSSLPKAILHGFFAFFKSYFVKSGFLAGYEGFVISAYNGHTAYYKYLKLLEANLKRERDKAG